jgi:hypothetical protein
VSSEPRNTTREKKLCQALAGDLEDLSARKYERSFDDLVEAFRAVESSYLVQFESNQFLALETRRRVAEMRLKAATFKCCPLETCRAQLDHLFRLGFTDLERKATMCIFFAQYRRETGIAQQGIDVLEPVQAELQAASPS